MSETINIFQSIIIPRDGLKPLSVKAKPIGFKSGRMSPRGLKNSRWTEATVYITEDNHYLLHISGKSSVDGERERNWVGITNRPEMLPDIAIARFGQLHQAVQACLEDADIYSLAAEGSFDIYTEESGATKTLYPLGKGREDCTVSVERFGRQRKISVEGVAMNEQEAELFTLAVLKAIDS